MAVIPSLLQLCAEEVAYCANEKIIKIPQYLRGMQLPVIYISYVKNDLFYKKCEFRKFVKRWVSDRTIVRSKAKWPKNSEIKLSVGTEQLLYVSTLADLGVNMLKLDFPMGDYKLSSFENGYVLKKVGYQVRIEDAVQIFNCRDGGKGLAGTLHGMTDNEEHMRIFNDYIGKHIDDSKWWEHFGGYPYRTLVDYLEDNNNVPVIFYLTSEVDLDELEKITLSKETVITDCGNIDVCWYVYHRDKGNIGIAVKQCRLYYMVLGLEGLCMLKSNKFRAIGNFDLFRSADNLKALICRRNHSYKCEFNPCRCDTGAAKVKRNVHSIMQNRKRLYST